MHRAGAAPGPLWGALGITLYKLLFSSCSACWTGIRADGLA